MYNNKHTAEQQKCKNHNNANKKAQLKYLLFSYNFI